MANVLHRTTKTYLISVHTPDYLDGNWIVNPDMSDVDGVPSKYWLIDGDLVVEMDENQKHDVDLLLPFADKDLEAAIRLRHDEINAKREQILNSKVWFMNHTFLVDARARSNLMGVSLAIQLGLQLPPDFTWRDADNNINVPMDATTLIGFGLLVTGYVDSIYNSSWAHKEEVNLLTTLQEVAEYQVDLGWPPPTLDGSGTF